MAGSPRARFNLKVLKAFFVKVVIKPLGSLKYDYHNFRLSKDESLEAK